MCEEAPLLIVLRFNCHQQQHLWRIHKNGQSKSYQELLIFLNKPIKKKKRSPMHKAYLVFLILQLSCSTSASWAWRAGGGTICKASAKARAAVRGEHFPAAQRACQCCRKALVALLSPSDNMTVCDTSQGILVRIALRTLFALMTPKISVQN